MLMAGTVSGAPAQAHVCGTTPRLPARTPVRFSLPVATELETAKRYAIELPDSFRASAVDATPYRSALEGRQVVLSDVPPMSCVTVQLEGEFSRPGRYVLPVTVTQPSGRTSQYTDPNDMLGPAAEVIVTRRPSADSGSSHTVLLGGAAGVVLVGGALWVLAGNRPRPTHSSHRPHRSRRR